MITGLNPTTMLPFTARVSTSLQPGISARAASNAASSASASAKVTFGSQTPEIAAVYSLSPKALSASVALQHNASLTGLMQSVSGGSVSAFASLGSALLGTLNDSREDITQALSGVGMGTEGAPRDAAVALSIVTQSGSTVSLIMTQQREGLAIEMKTHGEALSDDEAAAVANLSGALEKTLNGLGQQPPQLDLLGLTNFDSSVLKSIDLKTDLRNSESTLQSLNFHADDKTRSVAYEDGEFSLEMSSDLSHPTLTGNAVQQQSALSAWDYKLDKARRAGHGDRDQMAVLKSVFHALNSHTDSETAAISDSKAIRIGDNGASQLSGLHDFSLSLSLTQTQKSANPARGEENDRFAYSASQSTEERAGSNGAKTVKQTTHSHLSAAWHEALDPSIPLALNEMKSSQNYYYHLLDNDEENSTTLNYNDRGQLANVSQNEQVNNRETVKKYVLGKLVDQTVTPEAYSRDKQLAILKTL